MVLAEPQGWALQLLDDGVIEVAILLPQLQEPGDLLLLVLLHGQEAGAVDGHHNLL